jgi:hypothetical protein
MTQDEARKWLAQVLMERVADDRFPSVTQLAMIEELLPREMAGDYLELLMDKVAEDRFPSISMLQRIQRVAAVLPQSERTR